jgi:N-acetylneuraminate synthase
MIMKEFKIGNRSIGEAHKPLVIAEIGINHGGDLAEAFKMVDAAILAGAEVIKHQTHVVEDEMSHHAKTVVPSHTVESIYEIIENCALNEEDETKLKRYVEDNGAIFISTPFSRAAADRLERMGVVAYKIGSGECNNYPLIEHISKFGKPMILSTGMNTIESIRPSVEIMRRYHLPFALLHCTNVYPTPYELVRLDAIKELKVEFPDAVVGLSDHTVSNYPCLGAVALGASVLERHFTDSMDRAGPDVVCSMDPSALIELIYGAEVIQKSRSGKKGPVAEEKGTIDFAYASVVTVNPIRKGEVFTKENLWVKRPGTGEFLAKDFDELLGARASVDLKPDVQLKQTDVLI